MKTLTGKDLINTYITNDNGKLLNLYMETCASVGLHVFHDGNEAFDAEFYRDGLFIACTEYSDPSSEGVLQLFMTEDDLGYELTWEELAKMNIDNLATQTPEEKEALDSIKGVELNSDGVAEAFDLIDTTPHQYEMSKFSMRNPTLEGALKAVGELDKFNDAGKHHREMVKLVTSTNRMDKPVEEFLNDLKCEVEWKNGDECVWGDIEAVFIGYSQSHKSRCAIEYLKDHCSVIDTVFIDELSNPEKPEAKEKREKLEAAYDLYVKVTRSTLDYETFSKGDAEKGVRDMWLSIVDKTNYRKAE